MLGIIMNNYIFAILLFTTSTLFAGEIMPLTWKTLTNEHIQISDEMGSNTSGKLIAYEENVIVIKTADGFVLSFNTDKIESVRIISKEKAEELSEKTIETEKFDEKASFGITTGGGPIIVGIEGHINNLIYFAAFSPVLLIGSEFEIIPFSVGLGRSFSLGGNGWKFDIVGLASTYSKLSYDYTVSEDRYNFYVCAGLAFGFHYVFENGVSFSFKIPVIGYSVKLRQPAGEGIYMFYPHVLSSLPAAVLAYRF